MRIITYTEFLKWMNMNKHLFHITVRGNIRTYAGLCPLQVWTETRYAYRVKAIEKGMTSILVKKIMEAADHATTIVACFNKDTRLQHKRDYKAMLKSINRRAI